MRRCRLGVVGVGHLGRAHARILAGLSGVELVGVVDTNHEQVLRVAAACRTRVFDHHRDLAEHIDAACVVTPTVFHHTIAADFLRRGIPVLVEKPLALNLAEADELLSLAEKHGTVLQVGHIERFNPAYEELRSRPINPKFIEAERHGAFTGRSTDIGAVMDLMIHDLDLLLDLVGGPVAEVEALGMAVFGRHEDFASARLRFESGCIAHLTASRLSPRPKRKMRIWSPEGYAGIDFCEKRLTLVQPSANLRRNGLDTRGLDAAERERLQAELFTSHLQARELTCERPVDQLTRELEDFVRCVRAAAKPRVDGAAGHAALALAERIVDQMYRHAWTGDGDCSGPHDVPLPFGTLLDPQDAAESIRAAA